MLCAYCLPTKVVLILKTVGYHIMMGKGGSQKRLVSDNIQFKIISIFVDVKLKGSMLLGLGTKLRHLFD